MSKETFMYFRIKLSFHAENEEGCIVKQKTEDLVMASSYTEAEKIAYELATGKDVFGDPDIEIIKTKISEIDFNDTFVSDTETTCGLYQYFFEESEDTEVGLYKVAVIFKDIDEKTGKAKSVKSTIYVPANASSEVIKNTKEYLKRVGESREYVIRKVTHDNAQGVFVTECEHNRIKNTL